ncbi:putative methyltransferase TARBP1 isoform 2-T2 [Molossus nigricans]
MEGVLAEALLAQSRDPGVLLGTVCRGEASAERLETLRFLLQRLEDEAARGGGGDALPEAAREVAAGFLVPLLHRLRARPAGAPDSEPPARHRRRLLRAASAALGSCARLAGDPPLAATLAEEALRDLLAAGPAPGLEGGAEAAVEVLAALGPCLRPREDGPLLERVAEAALSLALAGDGEAAALAAGRLLPALGQSGGAALQVVWGGLVAPSGPGRVGPRLQVLSVLAERLLPEPGEREAGLDARRCARFWRTVQAGLARAEDALTRKRARYLLRRAVEVSAERGDCVCSSRDGNGPSLFWWSEKNRDELLNFWENYILIMETLEGNQIHVIKPVLPKLNNLFECAVSEENGRWLFHPSWHLCIYKRMFESENKILTKEGVIHLLELYETKTLPSSPEFSEFVIGPLMDALSESSLYSRSPGQQIGSGSPLGFTLQTFLVTYISSLPEELKGGFLLKFIQKMTSRQWCAVPILFLAKALASVPRCKALGPDGLLALRGVLQCAMVTHQTLLRGAAQCYLLHTAMNLVDVEKVSLSDISAFLLCLRQEESLARGTSLWTELCDWLRVNENGFGRPSAHSPVGPQETCPLNAYVRNLVQEYVKSPAWDTGEDCWVPDWAEARLVALMVALAVDVAAVESQRSGRRKTQNVLRMFLDPLLDALVKLGTNAYLPVLRADRCLQLLVTLLHTCSPRGSRAPDDEVSPALQDLVMSTTESVSEFLLRRLTANELSSVSDLDRCRLYLQVFAELTDLHVQGGKGGHPIGRVIAPLKKASIRRLRDTDSEQLLASSESVCVEAFDAAWRTVSSLSNTQLTFWPSLKAFVQFVFDTKVLTIAAKIKGQAYFKIKEIMRKMIEMSAVKSGVFNTLITHCCQSWVVPASNGSQESLSSAESYGELVLEACTFGTVFRRDQRLIQDVQTFIENLGHDCAANVVIENTKREDHYVRICAVKFLCLLDGSNMSHKSFMEDLAIKLLDKDELVSTSRTRYYMNSQQHRVKNRIWQILLVLFPRFDQNFLNRIIDKIFQAGFVNNQASIKYYIEWIIILVLHKFPQFLPKFWDCFSYGEENLKTSICTFLSVLSHLDIIMQNIPEKKLILKQALDLVLRWALSHNFSVRLYALVALRKIWSMCGTLQVEGLDALTSVIESSLNQVESVHGAGNAQKSWQRIRDHFFFAAFHPLEDHCLETIFYILPRLSGLVEDEWIAMEKFSRFTDIPSGAGPQRCLSPTRLRELQPGAWAQQDGGPCSGEAEQQPEWTDVQKKIIPWKNYVPDLDLELVLRDRAAKLGKSISRLIVVASLIDKPTNLGGLCRTCEVFGAALLVVGSLQCVRDKQFQHLSVSAEQWLPLVEVRPSQLPGFLQQKKAEGYTVVGAEQTARSAALTHYRFPESSLLLLGNEREGIPANLIQQLDVCVEIPQQGITRSLNVHVSAALLVWEYTRQQARPQAPSVLRSRAETAPSGQMK